MAALRQAIEAQTASLAPLSLVGNNSSAAGDDAAAAAAVLRDNVQHKIDTLKEELVPWEAAATDTGLSMAKVAAIAAEQAGRYRAFAGHRFLLRRFPRPPRCQVCAQLVLPPSQSYECFGTHASLPCTHPQAERRARRVLTARQRMCV